MNVLPVISRELRAQARQPMTHALRLLAVGGLLFGGSWFVVNNALALNLNQNVGRELFQFLHLALFISICLIVPFSAADCISIERREGTLGLLFLTPLRARDIVMAKAFAHGFRTLGLLIAVVPVFAVSFLMGGVSWQQVVVSLLVNFSAVCITLGMSMIASASNMQWMRSLVIALLLSVCVLKLMAYVCGVLVVSKTIKPQKGGPITNTRAFNSINISVVRRQAYFTGHLKMDWRTMTMIGTEAAGLTSLSPPGRRSPVSAFGGDLLISIAEISGISLLLLFAAVIFAARRVRRVWQEEPPSARQAWIQKKFLTPVLGLDFYRKWMRRLLDHNPIGWLERRTWQGRLLTWIWFAIIISVYSMLLTDGNFLQGAFPLEEIMGWLMALTIAATASGSFRRERETGVLELLLVAPLHTHQIIWARLRGIWGQFAPASVTFLLLWLYVSTFVPHESQAGGIVALFVTLFTIPAIGLYFSLRCKGFIGAFLWTLICGVALPKLAALVLGVLLSIYQIPMDADLFFGLMTMGAPAVQMIMASLLLHRLWKRLETRSFTFERAIN